MQNGAGRDGHLVPAGHALPEQPPGQLGRLVGPTGGAAKGVRPSRLKQVGTTRCVVRKSALELEDRPRKARSRHDEIIAELSG